MIVTGGRACSLGLLLVACGQPSKDAPAPELAGDSTVVRVWDPCGVLLVFAQ